MFEIAIGVLEVFEIGGVGVRALLLMMAVEVVRLWGVPPSNLGFEAREKDAVIPF